MCVRRLLAITDVMRMSCGCRAAACSSVRFALRPSIAPLLDTDDGEGSEASLPASFGFLPSAALVSVWDGGGCLLACSYVIGRISSAMRDFCGSRHCGCRGCFAMVYCHCVVREDEHGIGSSGFLSLVFLTRFPLRLTPTSSLVSTPIATTGVLLILSLRPIAHGSLLSTRLASSALPMADEARCFLCLLSLL